MKQEAGIEQRDQSIHLFHGFVVVKAELWVGGEMVISSSESSGAIAAMAIFFPGKCHLLSGAEVEPRMSWDGPTGSVLAAGESDKEQLLPPELEKTVQNRHFLWKSPWTEES